MESSGQLLPEKCQEEYKESIDSGIYLGLYDKGKSLIYEDSGKRAGLEIIDKIFKYV